MKLTGFISSTCRLQTACYFSRVQFCLLFSPSTPQTLLKAVGHHLVGQEEVLYFEGDEALEQTSIKTVQQKSVAHYSF